MENRRKTPIRLETLRQQIARLEGSRWRDDQPPVSSGCGPLDRLLPGRGLRRGTLAEWLAEGEGNGATALALGAACAACRDGGALVVLDRSREFYPPAAVRLGIELENLIVVYAAAEADNIWALDQALRCPGVAAVVAWPQRLDGRTFRRLQLAAEESGSLGLLMRPATVRHEPSWADVRLLIEPLPAGSLPAEFPPTEPLQSDKRRLRIHLLHCRHGGNGRCVDVEIDDETHTVYLVARLADPTAHRRAAGA